SRKLSRPGGNSERTDDEGRRIEKINLFPSSVLCRPSSEVEQCPEPGLRRLRRGSTSDRVDRKAAVHAGAYLGHGFVDLGFDLRRAHLVRDQRHELVPDFQVPALEVVLRPVSEKAVRNLAALYSEVERLVLRQCHVDFLDLAPGEAGKRQLASLITR